MGGKRVSIFAMRMVIAKTETGVSLPLEKNEFGAEGRPHRMVGSLTVTNFV